MPQYAAGLAATARGKGSFPWIMALCAVVFVFGLQEQGEASSWHIDQARYHISVHGALSCGDCHDAVATADRHPDPADVNKPLAAFFRVGQCEGCHGDVAADLQRGLHAGKPVVEGRDYQICIRCHNPHYQKGQKPWPAGFVPGKPVEEQCGACHAKRDALPALSREDAACLACHRGTRPNDPAAREAVDRMCLDCHGAKPGASGGFEGAMAVLDEAALKAATHKGLSCAECHRNAARFPHNGQTREPCLACHARHDEKLTHDAHLRVSCEACHLSGTRPVLDAPGGDVAFRINGKEGALAVHAMGLEPGEKSCAKCHFKGNALGAAAMVLPAKGVLCMSCHAATFSVGDATTAVSLLAFLAGLAILAVFWFSPAGLSGTKATAGAPSHGHEGRGPSFAQVADIAFYDILLQRRLYRESRSRWVVHALIYFPFAFRFLWGLAGLLASLWTPRADLAWALLDKNNPLGAFLFDVSGIMLLAGLVLAGAMWLRIPAEAPSGLPRRDWPALCLLGAIVAAGFVLEGMRIAMTGFPADSGYAFLGYALARMLAASSSATALSDGYGYLWYAHAILTGATVAYVPFSQLRHVITAPLAMLANAAGRK